MITHWHRVSAALLVALLAACAQMSHVASGQATVKQRLLVTVDKPWNQFERGVGDATPTWTQEGVTIDALRFYVGLKDGELLAPTPSAPKGLRPLAFKSTMQPNDVVALFEALVSRDGSTFTVDKLTPQAFVGNPGVRLEWSSVRKFDEVRLRGIGWIAVRDGELFAITYTAPRLAFFPRGSASAEAIAASARVAN